MLRASSAIEPLECGAFDIKSPGHGASYLIFMRTECRDQYCQDFLWVKSFLSLSVNKAQKLMFKIILVLNRVSERVYKRKY